MDILKQKDSAYTRKALFNALLARDLCSSMYRINASYQWKKPSRVFSLSVKDSTIRLNVNLNCVEEGLLLKGAREHEAVIRFRAYYIANYIHCLEAIYTADPQSFFSGLVNLEAITCLNGKKLVSYSPLSKTPPGLRAIDIYCAIRALTRLIVDCGSRMPDDVNQYCEEQINTFITFSQLPEIQYRRGSPVYSLPIDLKSLHDAVSSGKAELRKYPMFSENNMVEFEDMPLDRFAEACNALSNPFWAGAAIRLAALSGMKLDESVLTAAGSLHACFADYHASCIRYAREYKRYAGRLIDDNFEAVRMIEKRIENTVGSVADCGALHYIQ